MKKICHITTVHTPFDVRIFHKECKTLAKAGYKVSLIAPCQNLGNNRKNNNREEVIDGIKIIYFPKAKNRLTRILFSTRRAYQLALEQKADVYHFHDPEFLPWAKKIKKKTGKKIIYDIHEDYVTFIKQKGYIPFATRSIFSWFFNYIEKLYSKDFTKILAEKYYIERFPEGQTVLNYPILAVQKKENISTLNLEGGVKLIYTGTVSEDRGALIYANLVNLISFLHVYVIGRCDKELVDRMYAVAGSSRDRLHIEGKGFIPYERILAYYNVGDWVAALAIFPFSKFNYQKELTKFFEYMREGIPIIASDFPAWKKIIEGNKCGICINALDSRGIVKAIEYFIKCPEKAKKMGANGRRAVLEKYNWETENKKLIMLYNSLLEEKELK